MKSVHIAEVLEEFFLYFERRPYAKPLEATRNSQLCMLQSVVRLSLKVAAVTMAAIRST